ncbi:MAG: hypothetical protein U5L11_10840 [Arhodomonas sp.]|nr:hypothetical protein [Arhodomonas sp.]
MTVTCSPKHGIERTLEAAEYLVLAGFRAVPHIAARLIPDRGRLQELAERMVAAGIDDCFVVGGDADVPAGAFPGGVELLEALAGLPHAAGTTGRARLSRGPPPDGRGHPAAGAGGQGGARRLRGDPDVLRRRYRTGVAGRSAPAGNGPAGLRRGTGVMERRRLMSVAVRIGLGASTRALGRQKGLVGRLLQPSVYRADDLIWGLTPALEQPETGVAGLHVYTFNEVGGTRDWLDELHGGYCRWHGLDPQTGRAVPSAAQVEQPG